MVTIERRVGLLRYRKVWFPSGDEIVEISRSLQLNEVVRFFGACSEQDGLPHLVEHRQLQTSWVDLSAGPEKILNGMKRKSCRYEIRRAEKMLDEVEIEINSVRANRDFLTVYNNFAATKRLPKFPASWLAEYSAQGETLVLYLKGKPLCCHLLICDPEASIARLLYSGSQRLETAGDAAACGALNRYLHWHEMQRYYARGFETFDFGGLRDAEDPISRFKMSFGGIVVAQHYYLLSGAQWAARLGNLAYKRIFRRGLFAPKSDVLGHGAAGGSDAPRNNAE